MANIDGFIGYGEQPYGIFNNQLVKDNSASYNTRIHRLIKDIYGELGFELSELAQLESFNADKLKSIVADEFFSSLNVSLQNNSHDSDALAVKNKYDLMTESQKEQFISDMTKKFALESTDQNFSYELNDLNMTQFMNKFNILKKYLGRDRVEEIAREKSLNCNVCPNNVCFNNSTQSMLSSTIESTQPLSANNNISTNANDNQSTM